MGFFSTKCKECKSKINAQLCPYCKKDVCHKCLNYLILKDDVPEWFIGKKVQTFDEYKQLYREFCGAFRKRGNSIHCCDAYLSSSWSVIIEKVKKMEKDARVKAKFVILK